MSLVCSDILNGFEISTPDILEVDPNLEQIVPAIESVREGELDVVHFQLPVERFLGRVAMSMPAGSMHLVPRQFVCSSASRGCRT